MKLKNIPNILSVIRIILVVVFVIVFFWVDKYVAMVVFLLAGATDVVDGYLARRNNWITNLGKILDPFADKLMQCTVLISLYIEKLIPLWFVVPFIAKEFVTLLMGLIVMRKRSVVVVSKWYGKMTVCLFYATVVLSVLIADMLKDNIILTIIVFLPATVCALLAFGAYVKHYAGLRHKTETAENNEEKAETADAADKV
ncbi:MAG: CDP-diacylglycerol--glycerol-3-phosphate 3-phosphatidyltransferase [Ruminococcaceae bacterium]|nr:CDP-diacylglycerol--glycerol-3-phosphate 3-phosphatidyltransferase [Oscillospiraceae bacterium]